ncbi:flagellar hook-associated protein FlgL [Synergistaceae bacterium OttesenSCG-928-I11]|nr:flagellar hook-associated protein FlgL [Synergistaceae bacterium OttesenSCG-928-I11]
MSYRVTNSMMQSLLLNDMHTNLNKLLDVQQQLSTQRKYQSASDNPNAVTKGMNLETMMTETEQYIKNLEDAVAWLKFTDSALGDMNDVFQRMRELAIYAGDGILEGVDHTAIAAELTELRKELMSYANSTIAGEYLFAGLKTGTTPFTVGPGGEILYNGNDYSVKWEFARSEVGKVSITGSELFPKDEITNSLKGIELPLDFEWTGRNEILEFKVGWQTVKVRIPEKWEDELKNGLADPTDYNRYRDPGELEGYSLKEIADLINNSTEMGDVSKLLKAEVVTDTDRNVQYLVIKSHTGEAVRLTSWTETDPVAIPQGIKGAAYGPANRKADNDGMVTVRFDDGFTFDVEVKKGESLEDIAKKLASLPEGRAWSAYKSDGTNAWIDIVSRNESGFFYLDTTGGATALFAPEIATTQSGKQEGKQVFESKKFDDFVSLSDGSLTIRRGNETYSIDIPIGSDLDDIYDILVPGAPDPNVLPADMTVSVTPDGSLKIESANPNDVFEVTATGGLVPLLSDGVSVSSSVTPDTNGDYTLTTSKVSDETSISGNGLMYIEHDGKKYEVPVAAGNDLNAVATAIQTVFTAKGIDGSVEVVETPDDDGNMLQSLKIRTKSPIVLSGFGSGASVIGSHSLGSKEIDTNTDHTHIGFAAFMGMETTVKSTEVALDAIWDTTTVDPTNPASGPLHIKFVGANNRGEIYIEDNAELTIEQLAERINSVCGTWLQAVVETDEPDGTDPLVDPLSNSGDNKEEASKRLVLRTIDGEPFAIYDGPGSSYAQMLGINTALMGESSQAGGVVTYPKAGTDSFFDENMPAILEVTVGERTYEVKVCKTFCGDAEKVAAAIVRQVNEQYGGTLLAWDGNDVKNTSNPGTFSLYAVTGEPLRVIDASYGDPRFSEYTGGVAIQLGIAAGITSAANTHDDTKDDFGPGTIRINTPGHTVDVPVLDDDTLQDIAARIRDYAGSWLDVSFYDTNVDTDGGKVQISLAAKDGSALSIIDVTGDVASTLEIDTGLKGTADLNTFPTFDEDATLTITVNGTPHTIDLVDNETNPPTQIVQSVEDLAEIINTRFQGQDIRAEVIDDGSGKKYLSLWSPKGYTFAVGGEGEADDGAGGTIPIAEALGFAVGNDQSRGYAPNASPYNQQVTHRTGNNQKETDFFGVLDNLIDCVEGGHVDGITDTMIEQLDNWMNTLLKCRAQVGALTSRYSTSIDRMTSNNTNYTDLHTKTVGVDMAEVITDYEMASSIYEASLAALARIMQPTLLDFLR